MADYNVNMKQWNGSSFDNVLPLAFNSKALEGKSYDDIIQYVQSSLGVGGNNCRILQGQYTGNGNYGINNPNVITTTFVPLLLLLWDGGNQPVVSMRPSGSLYNSLGQLNNLHWENNRLYWYCQSASQTYPPATIQYNVNGYIYYYIVFGYST